MTNVVSIAQSGANNVTMRNRIINGGMVIDQRNNGASVSTSSGVAVFTLDRWQAVYSQINKFTVQQNAGSVTPPSGFRNYLGITSSSAYSVGASELFNLVQGVEGFSAADFGWGTSNAQAVTLSFWVRSSLTGTFGVTFNNENINRFYGATYTVSAANTWEQKTVTISGDTSGTWVTNNGLGIAIRFGLGVGASVSGAAGSWGGTTMWGVTGATSVVGTNGATFYITGVQLEKGTAATPFEQRLYGTELALCQRYYSTIDMTAGNLIVDAYVNANDTYATSRFFFPVTMRTAPTGTLVATMTYQNRLGSEVVGLAGITTGQAWTGIRANALGRVYAQITSNNSLGNTYTLSAEL